MKKQGVCVIILAGLCIAMGVILPMAFHSFGLGTMFLPMHIPVLMGGCILPVPFALVVGAITPILSSVLTGMPPVFPVLPFMVVELATYGVVISLLYKRYNKNIYVALISGMLIGRVAAACVVGILVTCFMVHLPYPTIWFVGTITKGLPGIAIQIILIPKIVDILERTERRGIGA